jgi:salicylate hydroxylase
VTIYERADAIRDAGASISCAANGTKWLAEWGVDITLGNPIQIRSQIRHALETGEVGDVLDLSDYVEKWGHVSNLVVKNQPDRILTATRLQELLQLLSV